MISRSRKAILAAFAFGALAACQYKAEPVAVAEMNVYSSYGEKLPGKYLLYVDGTALTKAVKPSDMNCAAHSYPLDLRAGFAGSVQKTFQNLVAEIQVVQAPVDRTGLAAIGARGMIIVRGEDVMGRLRVVPGFWTNGVETDVQLTAGLIVDGPSGRLLGQSVSGSGTAQTDAGFACEGGANSLTQAAETAMKQTVGRLGEALTNSERVRKGL